MDVAAPQGRGGRLLVDPEVLIVDAAAAIGFADVLRSGGDAELNATRTIDVQQPIDGRGGVAGGKLTLDAGDAIAVNNDLVTNNGPVSLSAGAGGILMNAGPAVALTGGNGTVIHAGSAAITVSAAGDVATEHLVTSGAVKVTSDLGTVRFNRDLAGPTAAGIGSLAVAAGRDVRLGGVKTAGTVTVGMLGSGGTLTVEGPIVARGKIDLGSAAQAKTTNIILRHDVHTQNADIELYGTTWINPLARSDNVAWSPVLSVKGNGALFENPLVQVAVQTTDSGNVRFNGATLWGDGSPAPARPQVAYLYNARPSEAQRGLQETGYYGLHVGVKTGEVYFGGNVGMFDATTGARKIAPPEVPGALGTRNNQNGLWVTVSTTVGPGKIRFADTADVYTPQFRLLNANTKRSQIPRAPTDLAWAKAPAKLDLVAGANLPTVQINEAGDPNLIGPSPKNALEPADYQRVAALPEVPLRPVDPPQVELPRVELVRDLSEALPLAQERVPEPVVGGEQRSATARVGPSALDVRDALATTLVDPGRSAELGRGSGARGVGPEVSGADASPVAAGGASAPHADDEYFSQSPFEFVQTQSRRAVE